MLYTKQINSPIGKLTLVASEDGIREIRFPSERTSATGPDKHPYLAQCEKELNEYFAGKRKSFDVPLDIQGTDFQKAAWRALLAIPFGETRSYKEQATAIKKPAAVRAIGAANGANPIPIIVPCHRVIAANGHLHGYGGGLKTKQFLLELEGIAVDNMRLAEPSFL